MDDPFLEAIDARLADIEAAAAAERGPVDDNTRAGALQMLVENMLRGNTDCARRLTLAAAKLGPSFGDLVEGIIAKSSAAAERDPLAQSQQPPAPDTSERVPRTGGPPEGQGAPIGEPIEQMSARPLPVEPPQSPWYEDTKRRPGLQRAVQLKRLWRQPEPPDKTNPGSGWLGK